MNDTTLLEAPSRVRGLRLHGAAPTGAETPEQIDDLIRRACRHGRPADAVAAAKAALPAAETGSPRRSLLRELAAMQPMAATPPGETSLWLLRRLDGSMVGLFRLRDDGSVGVNPHPNESHWSLRNGRLDLNAPDGRATTRFMLSGQVDGRRVHVGLFMDDVHVHVLSEVTCQYAQLRLLDPELVGPFAGTFPPDRLAAPAMPAQPAVLLAAPRTGSHLLLNLLNSSGRVFFDAELLNSAHISIYGSDIKHEDAGALYTLRANDPLHFIKVMTTRSHHSDGRLLDDVAVRGFKLFPQQSHRALDWVMNEPRMRIVHLVRANLLAEFSSLLVAYAQGHWVGGPASLKHHRIHFQPARFERFVAMKAQYLASLRERLARREGDAIEIEYSAFSRESVNQVLSFLLQSPTDDSLNAQGLQKQLAERVIDRFDNPDDVRRCLAHMGKESWADVERPAVDGL
jgi:LPS sulfotransferase NodH